MSKNQIDPIEPKLYLSNRTESLSIDDTQAELVDLSVITLLVKKTLYNYTVNN